eukprot:CAMPEP_0171319516 /NCGR_PEP_ID=MMETSP0816-20121228/97202_1 /TAXON_ID=420281 /ORGANISM="Proboscia inermis, Strain CCAP1064/1" /LENGTH=44 /DNA_ID= /DNA_START= /DNA_END= /DNA_ORIENTATION=
MTFIGTEDSYDEFLGPSSNPDPIAREEEPDNDEGSFKILGLSFW